MSEKMNFYFCEGCGKRITQQEIQAGQGRDKKLKGVFCSTCAIGVTTMDTLPLSDKEAKDLLGKDETSTGTNRPSSRRTSGQQQVPKARGRKSSRRSGIIELPERQPARVNWLIPAGIGAVVFVVVLAGLLAIPSPTDAPTKTGKKKETLIAGSGDVEPAEKAAAKPVVVPKEVNTTSVRDEPSKASKPGPTNSAKDAPPADNERRGTKAAKKTDPTDVANTEKAPKPTPSPNEKAKPTKKAEDDEKGPNPASPEKSVAKNAKIPEISEEERARLAERAAKKLVNDVMDLLAKGDRDGARAAIKTAEGQSEFETQKKMLAAEHAAIGWLDEVIAAAREGIVLLQDGRPFALHLSKREIALGKGKADTLKAFKDDVLFLEHMEKQVSFPQKVGFNELTNRTVNALAKLVMDKKPDATLKLAWHDLIGALGFQGKPREALNRLKWSRDRLERALGSSREATPEVQAFMKDRLAWTEDRLKWMDVATAWKAALVLVEKKRWEEAKEGLESWDKSFAGTPFHEKNKEEYASVMKQVSAEVKTILIKRARSRARLAAHFTFSENKTTFVAKETPGLRLSLVGDYATKSRFGGGFRCKPQRGGKPETGIRVDLPKEFLANGGTIEFWVQGTAHWRSVVIKAMGIRNLCFTIGKAGTLKGDAPTRKWCHMALVFDDKGWELYANEKVLRSEKGKFDWTKIRGFVFGSHNPTRPTKYPDILSNGQFDNIRIWERPVKVFDMKNP